MGYTLRASMEDPQHPPMTAEDIANYVDPKEVVDEPVEEIPEPLPEKPKGKVVTKIVPVIIDESTE